ncbi:hypothetical protein FRC14_005825 [Serendipita sp. 396]|nr:hypothetical protein FRC14_005825 [Serendipita sp. 396]KAG8779618.1 hypothetical protein FRC15_010041 [Serendipita sp. 397]
MPTSRRNARNLGGMPADVLALIFEQYHLMDQPITPVMSVCKRFYHLIRRLPRLWRRILVSADVMPVSLKKGSTMACSDINLLKNCIKLAANAPLETTFVIGQVPDDNPPSPAARAERYGLVLEKSSRISFLCIIINPDVPLDMVVQSFVSVFTSSTRFDSLESLMIASAVPLPGLLSAFSNLLTQIEISSTKLTSLYFENVGNEFITAARQHAFWRRLRRLTLKGEHSPLHATAFEACSSLEFCSFSGELLVTPEFAMPPPVTSSIEPLDAQPMLATIKSKDPHESPVVLPADPNREVSLENVKWFRLGALRMSVLRRIPLQNLRFLVIQSALRECAGSLKEIPNQPSEAPPYEPYSLLLPNLETLHVGTTHSQINLLRLPKLRTLHLQIQALQRSSASSILAEIFPSDPSNTNIWRPKSLNLNASVHDKALVGMIEVIGFNLEAMTLTMDKLSRRLLVALRKRGSLPNLLRLTFELSALSKATDNDISTKMTELSVSRKKQGLEFAWLSCKWVEDVHRSPDKSFNEEESRKEIVFADNDICTACRTENTSIKT